MDQVSMLMSNTANQEVVNHPNLKRTSLTDSWHFFLAAFGLLKTH